MDSVWITQGPWLEEVAAWFISVYSDHWAARVKESEKGEVTMAWAAEEWAVWSELIWSLRRQMGVRQSEGGNRALGSPLSARTTVVLAHLLPQRHFPECQGLDLDLMPRGHEKQCQFSSKPLNSSDVRPVTDYSRPRSSTEKNYHMLLRKVLCYLRNPQVLQRLV